MQEQILALLQGARDNVLTAHVLLTLAFGLGAMTFVPRPVLCVIGGFVFGFSAVPFAIFGTTLGAALAFLLARQAFQARLLRAVETRPFWRDLVAGVDGGGWRLVALTRVASPVPSTLASYAFGLTRIGLWPFAGATMLGIVPQMVLYVYLGSLGQMAVLEQGFSSPLRWTIAVIGLVCTALACWIVYRRVRQAQRQVVQQETMRANGPRATGDCHAG